MSVLIGFIAGLITGIALILGVFFFDATVALKEESDKNKDKEEAK